MGRKKTNKTHTKARQRAQLIMKVRCGLMSACEAAKQLGVSRKTYYKWEQRGLAALHSRPHRRGGVVGPYVKPGE